MQAFHVYLTGAMLLLIRLLRQGWKCTTAHKRPAVVQLQPWLVGPPPFTSNTTTHTTWQCALGTHA